jgi:hypothetical protein
MSPRLRETIHNSRRSVEEIESAPKRAGGADGDAACGVWLMRAGGGGVYLSRTSRPQSRLPPAREREKPKLGNQGADL